MDAEEIIMHPSHQFKIETGEILFLSVRKLNGDLFLMPENTRKIPPEWVQSLTYKSHKQAGND